MAHEITKDNSVVYYCDSCRQESMLGRLSRNVTAKVMVGECTFCDETKLVNVHEDGATFIYLDDGGVAKETYVEREGV